MRHHPREDYKILEKKAQEHELASDYLFQEEAFDACVSVVCLSIINYMDALSINLFGKDNKCQNHEQAPIILQQKLNQAGRSDFKPLSYKIHKTLILKNLAAYESRTVSRKEAKESQKVLDALKIYYHKHVQRLV